MQTSALIVFITFPDFDSAQGIVGTLVSERLAACGNLIPGLESIYRWEGKVERAAEVLAILKTEKQCFEALEKRVRELHRYEVPECIAVPIEAGAAAYLAWVRDSVVPPSGPAR
jgi:periplasmic divalent cation tolerance protein